MTSGQPNALAPTRALGSTGLVVSPLCLGGNVFGWTADETQSVAVMDAYASAGGNFIDTADVYSEWIPGNTGGDSEKVIGAWLAARGNREDMIIATKVAKMSSVRGLAPDTIRTAVDGSLSRLGTDYIDFYYAHEDDPSTPIEDTLGAFDELVRSGKVRHIAASNFTADRLRESLAISAANGLSSYVAIQNHYNLMERTEYEATIEPIVVEHGLASLPYYSLARGFLTGKYRPGVTIDSPRAKGAEPYIGERGDRVLTALEQVAAAHHCHMAPVALAWLLTRPGLTAPLASARNLEQFADLVTMGTLDLTPEEIALLDAASA
ncbi:MAG: aldo/keto reductase [Actinobacteria bacterium]|nr:aldo/keto reductase [Actinomycetota bacterium]